MIDIADVYERLAENRKKRKELKGMVDAEIGQYPEYAGFTEAAREASAGKKAIRDKVFAMFPDMAASMQALDMDIRSDAALMSDLVLDRIAKGQSAAFQCGAVKVEPKITVSMRQMSLC
jgi:hypothetical protein